jgi:GT2 family glycosyltransferase
MTLLAFATLLIWLIALAWMGRTLSVIRNLPKIPNLLDEKYAVASPTEAQPFVSVIVPARNEAEAIEQTLRSLLGQRGVSVEVITIDDRSTDGTGEIMDRVAAEPCAPGKSIRVLHVEQLPEGWMGKTHAMALAARQASAPWVLFTDGDVVFREDCLQRVIQYAGGETDHVVLFPTLISKSFGERMMLSAIQVLTMLAWRLWKVSEPKSKESIGAGAFNLVRSDVYRRIGGFESLRMEVLEDLRLGYEVKHQGFRQRMVFGRDLIRIHWAKGALGIGRNLTKNIFAVFHFKPFMLLGACLAMAVFCLMPLLGLFGPWTMRTGSLLMCCAAFLLFFYSGRKFTGISSAYLVVFPVAACLLMYMMLRSMVVTLASGGVTWRGTFYPLAELRRQAGPLR